MAETQDQSLIKLVMGRQTKLESDKSSFNDRLQDVADYVCPHRDDIRGTQTMGERQGRKIYDGTAVSAAVLAADGIHGYHVSPAFPWFKYMMNRKEVNKIPQVKDWLQEIEFNMYMALNRSNFYAEMWSYIYDGFTLGTAPIYLEEDIAQGRIVFESVHPGEVYIAENRYGEVDILHRKRKIAARKIVQMFGLENCTDPVKQAAENNPFQEFEIIHAIFPREEYDDRKMDGRNKPFASVWILTGGNHVCRVSGMDRFGYMVWRYMKTGKSPYGVSPAHLAMTDIIGLNHIGKTLAGAAQLAVDPAYNVPSYLEGKVQLKPRGLNYFNDAADRITPVNTGGSFPIGIDREQAKQMAIKERFHVDKFLLLSQLAGQGERTAYEVAELMGEKAAILGAELGPLNSELDSILDRVYDIETAAGRMPAPPDILLEMADKDPNLRFDPVYMGPLAQVQREKFNKSGLSKFLVEISPVIQISPEVLDNFDADEIGLEYAEVNNLPARLIRDKDARDQIRKGRQEAAAQQAELEAVAAAAPAVKQIASADKDTGGRLMQAMGGMNAPS